MRGKFILAQKTVCRWENLPRITDEINKPCKLTNKVDKRSGNPGEALACVYLEAG